MTTLLEREKLKVHGAVFQAVRLTSPIRTTMNAEIAAYICGIKVGQSRIEGEFEPGDIVEFPIDYLPWVELPAEIQFVDVETGMTVSDPLKIATNEDAVALIGLGDIKVEQISIEQGLIRGTAVNRVNGLIRPQMFARINGLVPRAISVDPPRLLDDGGASFQFAAQLHPSDLCENGLTAEIFVIGKDGPLTSVAYQRADIDDVTKRLVELEAELAQLKTATAFKMKSLNNDIAARMDILQTRMDTFIEYAASFMFDRVAATEVPSQPSAPALAADIRAKVDQFLAIVREGPGRTAEVKAGESAANSVAVALRSPSFSYGWYDVEEDKGGAYRWMAGDAIIFNPEPGRPVKEVKLRVVRVYGADKPLLRCTLDSRPATIRAQRQAGRPPVWHLTVTPPAGQEPNLCHTLNIASLLSSSPAHVEGSDDSRILAIAVSDVVFEYVA